MGKGEKAQVRKAGVMLPVSALPSCYGIGDMGKNSYHFVDMLAQARVSYWQILPLNPLGFGNSPYQPYSSFAGDPLYIDLESLYENGLLAELSQPYDEDATSINYEGVRDFKDMLLREAFECFTPDAGYEAFAAQAWVYPYAVFMMFKRLNGMRGWLEWPEEQKNWPQTRQIDLTPFDEDIRYEMFLQYLFFTQWMGLKAYANAKGIEIIGDIPIYVGIDSLDVWMGRENFLLEPDGQPTYVAGVPPDYFSATGQRWGNPIYDWKHLEADGFAFWINRLRYSAKLFDVIRIDHFRGFDTYWEIPASCPTAVEGQWLEAPGYALFDKVLAALPGIQIIAEDLGMLRKEVYTLRDHYHFRGMKIVQFTFKPKDKQAPRGDKPHMVVYTGTHDNQTVLGWYRQQPLKWRLQARWSLLRSGYAGGGIARQFLRLALDDAADIAIIPAQDLMGLDDSGRINTPGTVGSPNWEWKLKDFAGLQEHMPFFMETVKATGRTAL